FLAQEVGGQAVGVRVVVPAAELGGDAVVTRRGPGAADFVSRDAHADARAANQDAALHLAAADLAVYFEREVRVIDAARVVRADVDHLVAVLSEQRYDALFDDDAAMIATDGDFHFDTDTRASTAVDGRQMCLLPKGLLYRPHRAAPRIGSAAGTLKRVGSAKDF